MITIEATLENEKLKTSLTKLLEDFQRFERLPIDSRKLILEFVEFFKITSRFQDEIVLPIDDKYHELQSLICGIGRRKEGFNRTEYGEEVTTDTIYLGNKYGLPVMSISKWLEEGNPDELAIISHNQVRELIVSAHTLIRALIPELLKGL